MAITYGFFNSVDGDRKYSADDIGRYLHGIVSSGVYADTSSSLQVLARDALTVLLQPGRAMLDYHYAENDAPMVLSHNAADTQDRYDAIVLRLDVSNRKIVVAIKKGTPAASPTVPTVTRSDTTKEYMLAYVHIRAHATAITQEDITDTRPDNSVCGWVHGLIQQVDTSTLHKQYEDAYAKKMAELDAYIEDKKADIDSRLASIDSAINAENVVGVPIPTASNAGQVPTVISDGTGYLLSNPTVMVKDLADNDGLINISDLPFTGQGMYLYTMPSGNIKIEATKDAAGTTTRMETLSTGQLLAYARVTMILSGGKVVGYTRQLYNYWNGKTYTSTIKTENDVTTYSYSTE